MRAIYDQDMSPLNDSGTCFAVQIKFLSDEIRQEDIIKVWFRWVRVCLCVCGETDSIDPHSLHTHKLPFHNLYTRTLAAIALFLDCVTWE